MRIRELLEFTRQEGDASYHADEPKFKNQVLQGFGNAFDPTSKDGYNHYTQAGFAQRVWDHPETIAPQVAMSRITTGKGYGTPLGPSTPEEAWRDANIIAQHPDGQHWMSVRGYTKPEEVYQHIMTPRQDPTAWLRQPYSASSSQPTGQVAPTPPRGAASSVPTSVPTTAAQTPTLSPDPNLGSNASQSTNESTMTWRDYLHLYEIEKRYTR